MARSAPKHNPSRSMARVHVPPEVIPPTYGQGRGGRPWRRKRGLVLKRDGYLCQCEQCQQGDRLPKVADEVDHIVPLSQGGTDDLGNLRAINSVCHKIKTGRESGGRR